ncbi:MAG: uracil phosphoribosyltransferase [Bacteroidales bacterium]|nr:uracil phosphoribosyltransferase [Bacteroidales bacterium]MCF8396700.1 uracil phosphoribosyltransferase [Bacteroidales bacterium]
MLKILGNKNTLFDHYLAQLRDVEIQKDRMRFRKNLERIGEIFAYEISKEFQYEEKEISTSLGISNVPVIADDPVLITLLRAGLPIHQGMLNMFDKAQNGFISSYRKYNKEEFTIKIEYVSCPDLNGKTVILTDSMIATGESMVQAMHELTAFGEAKQIHVVTVLASDEGIEKIRKTFSKEKVSLWVGAIEHEMTARAFLVPGLGDAGDLAYGAKE